MASTAWPFGRCGLKIRSSGAATFATNGAGQPAGNVTGTNVPPGGADGHSGNVCAEIQARALCGGVGGGASALVARVCVRADATDVATLASSSARRATVGRESTVAVVRSSASAIAVSVSGRMRA